MNKGALLLIVATILLGTATFEAKAWGTVAHHAAVYMAEQNLTTKARQEIHKYLPHSLTYYATWMDHYRCTIPYEPLDCGSQPQTFDSHYSRSSLSFAQSLFSTTFRLEETKVAS